MATDIQRAQNPMCSSLDPTSPYPDSTTNSLLSFSALADFDLQQQTSHNSIHNTWPGAQNWKMGDTPVYQNRPEGQSATDALEAFGLHDYYYHNLEDSPQSYLAITTPSDRSSISYTFADPGSIAHRLPPASYPHIIDNGFGVDPLCGGPTIERNIFSSGGCSSASLNSKASHASIASSASGKSEYLLTPRQSTTSNPYSWDDISGSIGPSPTLPQFQAQWDDGLDTKAISRQSRLSSTWTTNVVPDVTPLSLTDVLDCQGTENDQVWTSDDCPTINVCHRRSIGGRVSLSVPPSDTFTGRDLSSTFETAYTYMDNTTCSEPDVATAPRSLLPSASIVGNVTGWQSSSPTYPSMLDFEDAALHHAETCGQTNLIPQAGPSGLAAAYLSVPGGTSMRKARSTDGTEWHTAQRTKTLFAFHPVESLASASIADTGPDTEVQTSTQIPFFTYSTPQPGMSRRNTHKLQIQVNVPTAGGSMHSQPMSRAHTQPGLVDLSMCEVPILTPPYTGSAASPYYVPPPYYGVQPQTPMTASPQQPSVLASAPGGIQVAPPLSSASSQFDKQFFAAPQPRRPRTISTSRRAPAQPILTSEPLPLPETASIAQPVKMAEARPIANLPMKRKASQPKSRKNSGAKPKVAETGGISFGSFINYTAKDAAVIQAGVAPSGSKTKRRSDDEGDFPTKRSKSAESLESSMSF